MSEKVTEVRLPDLGDVESALVVGWLCEVGDAVEADDDLVEVETEKTTFVVPAPAGGRLEAIRTPEGVVVRVGEVLGSIAG